MAVLALGIAAVISPRAPGAALAVLIAASTMCVLVTLVSTDAARPTWVWLVFPVLLVGSSPLRRWTTPFCLALTGLLALLVAGLNMRTAGGYAEVFRVVTFGVILLGLGDLTRRSVDAFSIEVARGESLNLALARAASASASFVASVARYLTSPLRDIEAAGGALASAETKEDRVRACRQIILAADEVDSVVDDVLDRERIRAGLFVLERAPVDLADLVMRSGAAAGHAITVEGDRCLVVADEDRLSYALTALLEAVPEDSTPGGLRASLDRRQRGVRLRVCAAPLRSSDPRLQAREALAAAVVEAHGGELSTDTDVVLWLPADDGPPDAAQPDADAVLRARDEQARWFVVLVLALVAVGLVLGPAWPGHLALFLAAQVALVLVERLTQPDVANPDVRTVFRVATIAVFGLLVAASGGLLSPIWIITGLLVVGDRCQSRRTTLGLGILGSLTVGAAVYATWPTGAPPIYGAPPMSIPLVTAIFITRVNAGIDTHRQELETLSRKLEASRATTTMYLAIVSHELRTPLTSVRGYAESLLLPRSWTADNLREFVTAIEEESLTLGRLIIELGDTAMIQRGALSVDAAPMDLRDALGSAVRRERVRSPERTIQLDCQPGLPPVDADSLRVDQLLANILDNAVKHAPASQIEVAAHADGDRVYVSISDHGPGIPPELRREVFEPFRRTPDRRSTGVGLGLYICKGIIDAHGPGAGIWCEETPGGGTTIRVALPRSRAAATPDDTVTGPDE